LNVAFSRPGSDLLSRVLRRSTIGAGAFHGRVRNGIGCSHPAVTTRSAKRNVLACAQKVEDFLDKLHAIQMRSWFCWFWFNGFGARTARRASVRARIKLCLTQVRQMDMSNENDQANRAISTGKLHALPHFHTRPINVVVFHGSDREYSFSGGFPA